MKIAVFTKSTTFHKGYGGLETQNKLLCEGLATRGYEIHVISPQKELNIDKKTENGVVYHFLPCTFRRFSSLFSLDPRSWDTIAYKYFSSLHSNLHFDLVIGQSSWALPIIKRKHELNVKVLSISHGSKIGEFQTRLKSISSMKDAVGLALDTPHVLRAFFNTQREFIHGSDKVIAVSNFVKKSIEEETFADPSKIEVVHNGVDPKPFEDLLGERPSSKGGEPIQLIYVGRILRAKGLFILIDAISSIRDANYHLNCVGEGEDLNSLKEYIRIKNLSDKVSFLGNVPYHEVVKHLVLSDIFLLPTLRVEGFPMTLVEAMFSELPCVASDMGGNSDAVINDETGFLLTPGDKECLKQGIHKLIVDPNLRARMGKNGKNKAYKEFSLDKMLDKYEEVIVEILRKN